MERPYYEQADWVLYGCTKPRKGKFDRRSTPYCTVACADYDQEPREA